MFASLMVHAVNLLIILLHGSQQPLTALLTFVQSFKRGTFGIFTARIVHAVILRTNLLWVFCYINSLLANEAPLVCFQFSSFMQSFCQTFSPLVCCQLSCIRSRLLSLPKFLCWWGCMTCLQSYIPCPRPLGALHLIPHSVPVCLYPIPPPRLFAGRPYKCRGAVL